MPSPVRFQHRILSSGEHCVTSADVSGLCAVADTEVEARREAEALVALLDAHGWTRREADAVDRERA